jgi:hypothetical protein
MTDTATPGMADAPVEPTPAYAVERGARGCDHCGTGGTWDVIGPDDVALGTSFTFEDDAYELAGFMNMAFEAGAAQARTAAFEEVLADMPASVEAMARATFVTSGPLAGHPPAIWEDVSDHLRDKYRTVARAALAALRAVARPTEEPK